MCLRIKHVREHEGTPEGRKANFLYGCRFGGGVLYRILVTASSALRERGMSDTGRGGGRILCVIL